MRGRGPRRFSTRLAARGRAVRSLGSGRRVALRATAVSARRLTDRLTTAAVAPMSAAFDVAWGASAAVRRGPRGLTPASTSSTGIIDTGTRTGADVSYFFLDPTRADHLLNRRTRRARCHLGARHAALAARTRRSVFSDQTRTPILAIAVERGAGLAAWRRRIRLRVRAMHGNRSRARQSWRMEYR